MRLSDLIPWAVAGVVGVVILRKVGATSGGIIPPPGQAPTLSDTALSALADRIYSAAWEGWILWENESAIMRALWTCGNDADIARLSRIYGTRCGPVWLDRCETLIGTVQTSLSAGELATLNAGLAARGITVTF